MFHLLYISRSGFQMYFGGRRMSTMSSYSDLFHAKFMSSHSWNNLIFFIRSFSYFFYSFMYILSILRGADFNNVIFRFDRYYIFVPQFATFAEKYHMVESTGIVLPRIYGWLASGSGPTRFLEVAKSYGGQFRSIWEHCLLYSNGSTDGDVNKSIEICLTRMVRGRPSRRT